MASTTRSDLSVAAGLSFVAGFVDTAGFIALFDLFTAHVTGNFVLIGAALVRTGEGVAMKLLALPTFVLVVAATTVILRSSHRRLSRAAILSIEAMLVCAFMVAGLLASPLHDPNAPGALAAGLLGVTAMAVQNAAARLIFDGMAPTTVMTGNVTQVVIDLCDLARVESSQAANLRARLSRFLPGILAFAAGAIAGAYGFAMASFWCLLLPVIVLAGLSGLLKIGEERAPLASPT